MKINEIIDKLPATQECALQVSVENMIVSWLHMSNETVTLSFKQTTFLVISPPPHGLEHCRAKVYIIILNSKSLLYNACKSILQVRVSKGLHEKYIRGKIIQLYWRRERRQYEINKKFYDTLLHGPANHSPAHSVSLPGHSFVSLYFFSGSHFDSGTFFIVSLFS